MKGLNLGDARAARSTLAAGNDDLRVLHLSGEQDRALERLLLDGPAEAERGPITWM
ncbi:hypothetical protein TUM20286_48270 [Pseudomonas tohonis]|uniref:Uncharacterized protein n=1 Tax=Pseudomonas tohonis TaxID=2725477 RepID=A0ABQ4W6Q1_9PSED|nr:hypothetical protein TUM20286_48270 [Pseudomonas tohonis]